MAEDKVAADDTVESEAVAAEEEALAEHTELSQELEVEEPIDAPEPLIAEPEALVTESTAPVLVEDVRHKGWDGWTVQKGRLPAGIDAPRVNAVTAEQLPNAEKFAVNGGDAESALRLVARAAE